MIKVFYCFPDYVDEFDINSTYNECLELEKQDKGTMYSLSTFEDDFNCEMISDLGYIKIFEL